MRKALYNNIAFYLVKVYWHYRESCPWIAWRTFAWVHILWLKAGDETVLYT